MNNPIGKLRSHIFWFLDAFRTHSVKKNLNNIKLINDNYSLESSFKMRQKLLNDILNHAKNGTPYYQNRKLANLSDFPVVNKNIIRDNFDFFQSEEYKSKKNFKVLTSGSTGTPFGIYQNKYKKRRNTADTIYFAEKSGFKLGYQLFFIRRWGEQNRKSLFSSWTQNIFTHDVAQLSDKDITGLLDKIKNSKSNKGILAYASAYDAICQYLDKNNSKPIESNIKSMIAIAEGLSDYAKESTKKYFGFSAVSRYSNIENGIIAQQDEENDLFHVNWASYVVEILNLEDNLIAKSGVTGRIVLTDLFNYATPMIRYDTGDLGVMYQSDENSAPVLLKVEGRKMDVLFNTKGELISSHIVHQICLIKGIKQYQLVQVDEKKYCFKISVTSEFFEEQKIIDDYKTYLGQNADITVQYVDDIPLLASGKRKKVINLFKQIA